MNWESDRIKESIIQLNTFLVHVYSTVVPLGKSLTSLLIPGVCSDLRKLNNISNRLGYW